jgi:hypothetical protein
VKHQRKVRHRNGNLTSWRQIPGGHRPLAVHRAAVHNDRGTKVASTESDTSRSTVVQRSVDQRATATMPHASLTDLKRLDQLITITFSSTWLIHHFHVT